ncbi:hypothetical protein AB0L78_31355, partial [Streptomyces albidoflavus]
MAGLKFIEHQDHETTPRIPPPTSGFTRNRHRPTSQPARGRPEAGPRAEGPEWSPKVFIVGDHSDLQPQFVDEVSGWVRSGELKY